MQLFVVLSASLTSCLARCHPEELRGLFVVDIPAAYTTNPLNKDTHTHTHKRHPAQHTGAWVLSVCAMRAYATTMHHVAMPLPWSRTVCCVGCLVALGVLCVRVVSSSPTSPLLSLAAPAVLLVSVPAAGLPPLLHHGQPHWRCVRQIKRGCISHFVTLLTRASRRSRRSMLASQAAHVPAVVPVECQRKHITLLHKCKL